MSENEDSTNEENNELIDNPEKTDDQTKKLEEIRLILCLFCSFISVTPHCYY